MNGTRAWNSSIDVTSAGVTPAACQVSRISAERSYAQGTRSPSNFSSRRRSISVRGMVSISGEK